MPDAPAAAAPPPAADMFSTYDPVGALGGQFAPAFIRGYKPSEDAVGAWQALHHSLKPSDIDQTRMPSAWRDPNEGLMGMGMMGGGGRGMGNYGAGRIPSNLNYGDPRGAVDPEALRVAAQGGIYDMGARRNAITQRLMENQQASAAKPPSMFNWMMMGG